MSVNNKNAAFIAAMFLFFSLKGEAQSHVTDSLFNSSYRTAVDIYHRSVYPANHLYNGPEYLSYHIRFEEGHPNFLFSEPAKGSVYYKGIQYENLSLIFDILRQELVVVHPVNNVKITLSPAGVKAFKIVDHRFIHIIKDSVDHAGITNGYYEVLYQGTSVAVFKRIKKTVREELSVGRGVLYHLKESNAYFIYKGNIYYPVSNRKSLLSVFEDRKREMHPYIKSQKISKQKNNEATLKSIAAHFDQLKTS